MGPRGGTLPETNIAPENGWLEDYFPIGEAYFQGLRQFQGGYSKATKDGRTCVFDAALTYSLHDIVSNSQYLTEIYSF